jgi:hypothetical protein
VAFVSSCKLQLSMAPNFALTSAEASTSIFSYLWIRLLHPIEICVRPSVPRFRRVGVGTGVFGPMFSFFDVILPMRIFLYCQLVMLLCVGILCTEAGNRLIRLR